MSPTLKSTLLLLGASTIHLTAADFYIVSGINTFSGDCPGLPVCGTTNQEYHLVNPVDQFDCATLGEANFQNGVLTPICQGNPNPPVPEEFDAPIPDGICDIAGNQQIHCEAGDLGGYVCVLESAPDTIVASCGTDAGCASDDPNASFTPLDSKTCVYGSGSTTVWDAMLLCKPFGDNSLGSC